MPFQSEKQKKWMWANKPEMAREWTSKYGSKIEAKKGTMAKKDKNWIQKATKNMRKDKPCTGKKFGGPTCPPGSKRYNLAKTFRKMNKAATGTMVKADTGTRSGGTRPKPDSHLDPNHPINIKKKWYKNPKKLEKMMTQLKGEYSLMRDSMAGKVSPTLIEKGKKLAKEKGFGWKPMVKADSGKWITVKNPKMRDTQHMRTKTPFWIQRNIRDKDKVIESPWIKKKDKAIEWLKKKEKKSESPWIKKKEKVIGDQSKGGTYTPGWKPHLSVRTAKRGIFNTGKKGMAPATKYKEYLRGMRKATSSKFPSNVFTAGKTGLGEAQLKAHLKTKLPKGATARLGDAGMLKRITKMLTKTPIRRATLAAGLAAGVLNEAQKQNLFTKEGWSKLNKEYSGSVKDLKKKKVQKKATGGEIIIGRGVDIDLL